MHRVNKSINWMIELINRQKEMKYINKFNKRKINYINA